MQHHGPGPRIVVLSGRDVIRYGMRSMLAGISPRTQFGFHLDPSAPVDVVVVDADDSTRGDGEDLRSALETTTAPVVMFTASVTSDGVPSGGGVTAGSSSRWSRPVFGVVTPAATAAEVVAMIGGAIRAGRRGQSARMTATAPAVPVGGLSNREVEVLTAVAAGMSNSEIAEALFLGINTVKTYIRTAYRKIGAVSRSQAVIWAFEHGLGAGDPGSGPVTTAGGRTGAGGGLDDAE